MILLFCAIDAIPIHRSESEKVLNETLLLEERISIPHKPQSKNSLFSNVLYSDPIKTPTIPALNVLLAIILYPKPSSLFIQQELPLRIQFDIVKLWFSSSIQYPISYPSLCV